MQRAKMFVSALVLVLLATSNATPASATNEIIFNVQENGGMDAAVGHLDIEGTEFTFDNTTGPCEDYFTLVASNGVITTKVNIDREEIFSVFKSDNITCTVKYKTDNCASCLKSIFVKFHIVDVNDVAPTFSNLISPIQELEAFQNIPVNQIIKYLQPRDDDAGENATVLLQLTSGNDEGYFRLDRTIVDPSSPNRVLTLNRSLAEVPPDSFFNLTIHLQDKGNPPLTSIQYIVINVIGVGDQDPPEFVTSNFVFQVPETHPVGIQYPFGQVNVSAGSSSDIFFQFSSGTVDEEIIAQIFGINPLNGNLYLNQSLNYDCGASSCQSYYLSVEARDPGSIDGIHASVHIEVLDANDEYPTLEISQSTLNILENQDSTKLRIQFKDEDSNKNDSAIGNATISFSYPVKYDVFLQKASILKFVEVTITGGLDREASPTINMTINVTDGGKPALHTSTIFTINVGDENDNAPQFLSAEFKGKVPESTVPGRLVMTVAADDPDEGLNSIFDFAITTVQPTEAIHWFNISATSGEIFVASLESYSSLLQPVQLTVTTTDHGNVPMSNDTMVTISFTPPYSFAPRSFQQYAGYDLFAANTIYLEFRTGKADGVVFYEMSPDGSDFTALELIDAKLYYTQKQSSVFSIANNTDILLNEWYSVLIDNSNKQSPGVSVWKRGEQSQAFSLLQTASSSICQESGVVDGPSLFIGGLKDAFAIPANHLASYDFSGCIATVVVDGTQLDMECPQDSRNVVPGCLFSPSCQSSCTSECVEYGEFPGCQCPGGFDHSSCNSSSDYEDIAVEGGGFVEFSLGYEFFYELVFNSATVTDTNVLQTISISIRPAVNDPIGVIFYSSTEQSQQLLEFAKTFRYSMYTVDKSPALMYIYEEVSLSMGVQYNITLQILKDVAPRLILSSDGNPRPLDVGYKENNINDFYPFATEPETTVSLGWKNDEVGSQDKWFEGCMSHFTIDSILIPVRGLMKTGAAKEFSAEGTNGHVALFCQPCIMANNPCPHNSTCNMDDLASGGYTCKCQDGFTLQDGMCTKSVVTQQPSSTATPGTAGVEEDYSKLSLEVIIGVAIVTIIITVAILITFGMVCRWVYIRGKKAHFPMVTQVTDHVGNSSKGTEATDGYPVGPPLKMNGRQQNAYILTTLRSSPSVQEDTDNDSTTDLHFSPCSLKRKTASNETGFQSSSELEDGHRLFPVVSDSGNEPYSSTSETESDYFTNTSGIVHAISPSDMHLVSSGSVMGVPRTFRMKYPLTSQEAKTLQVFRPDSAMLSDTDTDISTTTNNAGHIYSDNETNASDAMGPKWYKSSSPSTIIDAETNLPYARQAAVLHKHNRHPKHRPPNLKQFKVASPPHTHRSPSYAYYNGHHQPPQSSSPLIHSNRFEFPPAGPASAGSTHGQHFPMFEPEMHHRLPAISESMIPGHYSRGEPYQHSPLQHQRYSDNALYTGERLHDALPHPVLRGRVDGPGTPPYYTGYQGSSLTPGGEMGTPQYRDLNSFPKVNPITYYEQQERMKPTVDQDDSLNFLSEPYVQFEDVSTDPSVVESTVVESTVVDEEKELHTRKHLPMRGRLNGYTPSPLTKEYRMATTLPATNPKFGHSLTPTEPRIFSPASFKQFSSQGAEEASAEAINSTLESIDEDLQEMQDLSSSSSILNSPNKSLNHFPSADCTPPINTQSGDTLIGSNHEASPRMSGYLLPVVQPVK